MSETALVLLVAAAEPIVAALRLRHDPMAARGVPAHVTVLYPFRSVVDADAAAIVADLAAEVPPFRMSFTTVGRFPGQVVYLAPEPAATVRGLLRRFSAAFPDCPPYGGVFADVVPHLTVADGVDDDTADTVAGVVTEGLPVTAVADELTLLVEGDDGHWSVDRSWPLGGPGGERTAQPDGR